MILKTQRFQTNIRRSGGRPRKQRNQRGIHRGRIPVSVRVSNGQRRGPEVPQKKEEEKEEEQKGREEKEDQEEEKV